MSTTAHNCCRLLGCAVVALASATATAQIAETLIVAPGETIESGRPGLEAAWDAGVLAPVEEIKAPSEGAHYLAVAFRSASGVSSQIERYLVEVDGQGPVFEIAGLDQSVAWVASAQTLVITASDSPAGLAEFSATLGEQALEGRDGQLELVLDEHAAEIVLEGRDRLGNLSRRTLGIDRDAPVVSLECAGNCTLADELWHIGAEATLTVVAQDGSSGIASTGLSLDGAQIDPSLSGLDEGRHALLVSAVDLVGNRTESIIEVLRDRSGPELSWRVNGQSWQSGDAIWGMLPMSLEVRAEDPAGVAQLLVAGSNGLTPIRGPLRIVDDSSPTIVAVDELGNRTEIKPPWHVDDIPPSVDLLDAQGRPVPQVVTLPRGTVLRPAGSDAETGLARLDIGRGRSLLVEAPEDFVLDSNMRIELIAHDHAGNDRSSRWRISVGGRK